MGLRAQRKKNKRKFKVGDIVTWGLGVSHHPVLEVHDEGVVVDGGPGFSRLFVTWEGGRPGRGPGSGPLRKIQ